MKFNPGIDINITGNPLGIAYGKGCFGPECEKRSLDSIRSSLLNPDCDGPDPVYVIAMDVGKDIHKTILHNLNLLFGVVTYAAGRLGYEPVRSQGHIHKKTRDNSMSPPEVYEIWSGRAIVYMQETADDDPGRCFAVQAGPGDVVIVPPGWAHATISADPDVPLTFGAWCDRNYGFEYDKVRAHKGLSWFPELNRDGKIVWKHNPNYKPGNLIEKMPEPYTLLGIIKNLPIYSAFEKDPETFLYVANPHLKKDIWQHFIP